MGGREGGLLDLGVVVLRPAVELDLADLDERIVGMAPDLRDVEGVLVVVLGLLLGHDLDVHLPLGEVALGDGLIEVAAGALAVAGDQLGGLGVRQVLDTLLGAEVELDPHALVSRVIHREGVLAVEVHVAEAVGDAAVGHDDRGLVEALG